MPSARSKTSHSPGSTAGAFLVVSLEGKITSSSDAAAQLFSCADPHQLVGRAVTDLLSPLDGRRLARVFQGEVVEPFYASTRASDGEIIELSVAPTPLFGPANDIIGAAILVYTAEERTAQIERALDDEARARLAAIVDSSSDAIVSKTLGGTITSWNRAAERLFGYSASEAIGSSILMIIPPDRRSEEEHVIASIRRGENIDHFETLRLHKDGSIVEVSLTVSPVKDERGRIIGASKIARDISDRRRAEEERARLLHEAQQSNRAKDQFLAMLGHELRNPLSAIHGAVQLLDRIGSPDPAAGRARAIAIRQTDQLAKLVDDLLDVGRIMTGKIMIQAEPLDLGEAVGAHMATLRAAGKLDAHRVTVDLAEVLVRADAVRLEQIISNLVGNALRYTPSGGSIRVTVERTDTHGVLRVQDDGVGIAPELLPHIFDLFVQSERRLDRTQGGLGIGLALVRRLVDLQGGEAEGKSDGLGRGSSFVVRLPALARRVERAPARKRSTRTTNPRRVLLVEDNEDSRVILGEILEHAGHTVYHAGDGREGVEAAARLRPDVAVLDVGLPELDGYEAASEIRARVGSQMLLVALTGYGSEEDRQRAMDAGFDVHLRKPIDLRKLEAILEDVERKGDRG